MENLILSLEIVLPLFIVMAVGYFVKVIGLITESFARQVNSLVFHVFLPVLLCKNIYQSSLDSLLNPGIFLFSGIGIIVMFLILMFFVPRVEKDHKKCGAMVQAMFRGNYAYFGIPLVQAMFPGADTSVASLLVVVVVPIFNVLAVIDLEVFRGGKPEVRSILRKIITNPLIIGSLCGLVILLTGLKIPEILQTPINDLSKIATPLALFLLGASIDFSKTGAHIRNIVLCVGAKLVVFPLAAVLLGILLGFTGVELACILIVFGAPAAVNSAIMAQQMDSDGDLATEAVVFSTAGSAFTIFLFIFVLKSVGLF